jgi:MFS family permease
VTEDSQDDAGWDRNDPYKVLRNADFTRFLTAALLVRVGAQMQSIAVAWEVYERTASPLALGLTGLAQVLPVLLLAIPAGHLSDRHDRKALFVASNLLMLVAAGGLAAVSATTAPVGWIYVFLAIAGVAQAINRPLRWAILPMLVSRDLLLSSITWSSSVGQFASVAGPTLGGFVIAVTARATDCYAVNFAFLIAVTALNSSLRMRRARRDPNPVTLRTVLAGLRFVLNSDLLLAAMTLDLVAVLLGGATALLPIYARDILEVGPEGLGWLRAAPSAGSFAVAILLAHRGPIRRAGPVILGSVAGFGVATIVFGLSRNFYLSLAALALTGAFDNVSVVVRQTLTQLLTPDDMRGRVSAVNTIFVSSSNELGEFESGLVARFVGTVGAVVIGGVGTLATVACIALIWPNLRRLGSLRDLAPAPSETSA